jgi:hypothetical protein
MRKSPFSSGSPFNRTRNSRPFGFGSGGHQPKRKSFLDTIKTGFNKLTSF